MLDPKITNRRICLLQEDVPPSWLMHQFDQLPIRVRQAIADSPFQLCVACITQAYNGWREEGALAKIREMERLARALRDQ